MKETPLHYHAYMHRNCDSCHVNSSPYPRRSESPRRNVIRNYKSSIRTKQLGVPMYTPPMLRVIVNVIGTTSGLARMIIDRPYLSVTPCVGKFLEETLLDYIKHFQGFSNGRARSQMDFHRYTELAGEENYIWWYVRQTVFFVRGKKQTRIHMDETFRIS